MLLKCNASSIAFEEMKHVGVISISTYAIVDGAWLGSSEPRRFCVRGLECICMLWMRIDLVTKGELRLVQECGAAHYAKHAELVLWNWWHASHKIFLLILCFADAHVRSEFVSCTLYSLRGKLLLYYKVCRHHLPCRSASTHHEQR